MNTAAQIAEVIRLGVALTALWALFFWLIRDYRIDAFRQRLFNVRDELFDAGAAGVIPFDHPAYGMLRKTLNGCIRFAHCLNLTRVTGMLLASIIFPDLQQRRRTFSEEMQKTCDTLETEEAKKVAMQAYRRMSVVVFDHILTGAPILVLVILAMIMWMVSRRLLQHGLDGFGRLFSLGHDSITRRVREELAVRTPGIDVVESEARIFGGQIQAAA
jgi:hypothetical protein